SMDFSESARRQDFSGRRTIAGATDHPRSTQTAYREAQLAIQPQNPRRRLIRQHHGSAMARKKLGQPHLLVPSEALTGILRELDVVRRIGIDKVARLQF